MIGHIQAVAGSQLTSSDAQRILEAANAWEPRPARALAAHLAEHPDALTAPISHSPAALPRLLLELAAAGFAVTRLACARCGRTDDPLPRNSSVGRLCNWCVERDRLQQCTQCERQTRIHSRTADGPVCRSCFQKDPVNHRQCDRCQRLRPTSRPEGTNLCSSCNPRPKRSCIHCGTVARASTITDAGPICPRCYERPTRPCGICGQTTTIKIRATDTSPDICEPCSRHRIATCEACGHQRRGAVRRGGTFLCHSCQPRTPRTCADCGKSKPVTATYPVGVLCSTCYHHRRRNPRTCVECGNTRIAAGRTSEGGDLCGPCSGRPDLHTTCRQCDYPGDIYANGRCTRCAITDRITRLLAGPDGTIAPPFLPLADALTQAEKPWSVMNWLRTSAAAGLLDELTTEHTEISHGLLDRLPQSTVTRNVRHHLVMTGALPERHETFARLELWARATLEALPPHQFRIVSPFAEWHVIKDARRRAERGRYTPGAAKADRGNIRAAILLLNWLDQHQLTLPDLHQEDLDLWLTQNPTRQNAVHSFVRWLTKRKLTRPLETQLARKGFPANFQTDDEHEKQLRRCLTDEALPRELRIVGALIRLYALPIVRIKEFTTSQFHQNDAGAFLTIDRHPVLLPPTLARLIKAHIASPQASSMLKPRVSSGPDYLLPGRHAGRPLSASHIIKRLWNHDLPTRAARNTAMINAITELPPIVVSDLFGLSAATTFQWAKFAQQNWTDYLALHE